jgi:uncharacterized DUF497 family protein
VLLATDSDTREFIATPSQLLKAAQDHLPRRINPFGWVLLKVTCRQARNQVIALLGVSENIPGLCIQSHSLCALCPAVNSYENHGTLEVKTLRERKHDASYARCKVDFNAGKMPGATPLGLQTLKVTPKEIEESFEDPFAVRLLPDGDYGSEDARYICLGRSVGLRPLFSVFWTDGKRYRVIISREMTKDEESFYDRRNAQNT